MAKKRNHHADYKKEYARDQSSPSQIKDRSARNAARKKLGLKKGDPREAGHKDDNPRNNSKGNLKKVSRKSNRVKANKNR